MPVSAGVPAPSSALRISAPRSVTAEVVIIPEHDKQLTSMENVGTVHASRHRRIEEVGNFLAIDVDGRRLALLVLDERGRKQVALHVHNVANYGRTCAGHCLHLFRESFKAP